MLLRTCTPRAMAGLTGLGRQISTSMRSPAALSAALLSRPAPTPTQYLTIGWRQFSSGRYALDLPPSGPTKAADLSKDDMTRNLRCKGIIFDTDVLVGDRDPAHGPPSAAETAAAAAAAPAKPGTDGDIAGVSSVQSKYMKRLRDKLGAGTSAMVVERSEPPPPAQRGVGRGSSKSVGDAALLMSARGAVNKRASEDRQAQESGETGATAGAWLLRPGMGNIVDYVRHRSMRLGLLSGLRSPTLADTLVRQMSDTRFVRPPGGGGDDGSIDEEDEWKSSGNDVARLLSVLHHPSGGDAQSLLLVSRSDAILQQGADLGLYTCRYRADGDRYGNVGTHYTARSPLEVQDVLEDLNGIAMRASAFSSRSYK